MVCSDLRLVVFDLDGTLIDSRRDLANSVNATLRHLGWKDLSDEVIATYIGDGASMLVRRALAHVADIPPLEEQETYALEFFLDYYREHKLDFTHVYEGVVESLRAIHEHAPQVKMAVLTNKPVRPSRQICDALGLSEFFFQNYGGDSFVTKKPNPEGLFTLMREAGVSASQTVMVGDSKVDVATAQNAGVVCVGCSYGLSPDSLLAAGPDVMAASASEWTGLLVG
ncbi:MAG: HAD-IA family hydrolase [Acidobacteria bacterium]|nr:HAD-IA family hydrolase [Acidobacteriota bacterium]